jgi:MFS family permease
MSKPVFLGWRQVLVCFLAQAVSAPIIATSFSVVIVPIGEAFHPSRMLLMLPMTIVATVSSLSAPIWGWAVDRLSMRNLMLLGATLLAGGFVALSFATSMIEVLLIYGIACPAAMNLLGPLAVSTLLSRWFTKKRATALGLAAAGISLGGFLFPPLIQALITAFEWRMAFRLIALIIFLGVVPAILLFVVNRPSDRNLHPDGDSVAPATAEDARGEQYRTLGAVLRDPTFWLVALMIGLTLTGTKGLMSNLVPLAMDIGVAKPQAALVISFFAAAGFAGQLLFAALGDRIDPRLGMSAILVLFAVGMLCFFFATDSKLLFGGGVLLGLGTGAMVPLWGFLLARSFGPENVGRVMGLMSFAILPFGITPPLFGWVFDKTGSYDDALLFLAVALLVVIALVPRLRTQESPAVAAA